MNYEKPTSLSNLVFQILSWNTTIDTLKKLSAFDNYKSYSGYNSIFYLSEDE